MRNGICPKCGSTEVYSGATRPVKANSYGMNAIPIKGMFSPSLAALDNYVCGRCGYVENYVAEQRKLQEIIQNWTKVPVDSPRGL